jgi:peptidoglycan hydrolase-like protein with peptidoglycan-binding domain
VVLLLAAIWSLAACGTTTEDRAAGGAGIGAVAGTVIGALTGFGLVQGALVGAGAGALTGAVTTPAQVDLGRPIWKSDAGAGDTGLVRNIQDRLQRLGYDPGPSDGVPGARTRAAIQHYQQDNGLAADGQPTPQLWQHLRSGI